MLRLRDLFLVVIWPVLGLACHLAPDAGINNTDLEFSLADPFQLDTIASEPEIRQPLYMTFDERGRIWVVQYLQFPFPAGLKVVSHDRFWRVQYDRFPPPPPPGHIPGRDRVTILEDRDGDGRYETQKDFVNGLNICSAALPGRGGVWVLNPPYLLFYPDADRDDVPDGPPAVHLEGFGLEDLHSVSNSLLWGPDGWLYGCTGSTTTATIRQPGKEGPGLHFKGQSIWRYHPGKQIFELFAEGGYNNFGLAMDAKGRLYTGTNGSLIGVHYVQGGYYRKTWGKHGPLTNPYAFGFFPAMEDHSSKARLSQAMIVYDGGQLPDAYEGTLITARVLRRRLDVCDLESRGSTYAARERETILSSPDVHFRPVDLKAGPDGAIYIADWYDRNVTWNVSAENDGTDRSTGRIYRLGRTGTAPAEPFDLSLLSGPELVDLLLTDNKWQRQMAQRLLRERKDASLIPRLEKLLATSAGQPALEALWALRASGGFSLESALRSLDHRDPFVRIWTIRLLGDDGELNPPLRKRLQVLAADETHPQVRSQLSSSVKRFPLADALPVLSVLLEKSEDLADPHIPLLLWWAVEAKLREGPNEVLHWVRQQIPAATPLMNQVILPRLGQRFTVERNREDLVTCHRLLELELTPEQVRSLAQGMIQGLRGAPLDRCPPRLLRKVEQLSSRLPSESTLLDLAIRLGSAMAVDRVLARFEDPSLTEESRIAFIHTLAECRIGGGLDLLLDSFRHGASPEIRAEALGALHDFPEERVAHSLLEYFPDADAELRPKLLHLLASRVSWARLLLDRIDSALIPETAASRGLLVRIASLEDEEINRRLYGRWGRIRQNPQEKLARMSAVRSMLTRGRGSSELGADLFRELCSSCHRFRGVGTQVGPDLTQIDGMERDALMEAIVDPGSSILPDFMGFVLTVDRDGTGAEPQLLEGLVLEENPRTTTIVDSSGSQIQVPSPAILHKEAMQESIMPDGLLHNLDEEQIRDLFAYLRGRDGPQ